MGILLGEEWRTEKHTAGKKKMKQGAWTHLPNMCLFLCLETNFYHFLKSVILYRINVLLRRKVESFIWMIYHLTSSVFTNYTLFLNSTLFSSDKY